MIRKVTLFVALLSLLGMSASHAAADYRITDLGTFAAPHTETYAYGLNESGEVVGTVYEKFGRVEGNYAVIWQDGRRSVLDLGVGPRVYRAGYGVNGSGQVVGTNRGDAFLWQNGMITNLGPGIAHAINAFSQVVGASNILNDQSTHAFFWQSGTRTDLGQGSANAINARGQIAGSSNGNAVLWQNGTMTTLGPGSAAGINASGQIVGSAHGEAVLWQNSKMTDLGPGFANAINSSGQVVGGTLYNINGLATLWQNGTMTDLNQLIPPHSGWRLSDASAINDAGQIVGFGLHNGQLRAFLLTPSQAPVPEPSTLLLLGIGSIGLLGWMWRRRRVSVAV